MSRATDRNEATLPGGTKVTGPADVIARLVGKRESKAPAKPAGRAKKK